MDIIDIKTVKDLKDLIKDLPDDLPIGTYYINHWNPELRPGGNMFITKKGLAVNIDYSYNY
jgi:hypothetical protein